MNADSLKSFSALSMVSLSDIVGFTKWSSNRDPEQIFTLLQTIFGTFDAIARKHKVLKIEAIGDCYVAVTGMVRHGLLGHAL